MSAADDAAPGEVALRREDLAGLSSSFAPRPLVRDLGRTSWFLIGIFGLIVGLILLLAKAETIVGPVVVASVVAAVFAPVVSRLVRRRVPRLAAAALVLLALVALAVAIVLLVVGGITSQRAAISERASSAADKAASWLKDAGMNDRGATSTESDVKTATPQIIRTLTKGVVNGIKGTASLVFTLSLMALSLFFLLKDGPSIRGWVDGHLGVPRPVATTVTDGVIRSLRGYFRGVTLVAGFNGVVVGLGALLLGVPLAGTIAVVTFVTAYIPFIGAFAAGTFAVVIALGAKGTTIALVMLVIVILANGLLQNIVQPFAMGSALDLHPLAVLVITIGSGCIFGTLGLILSAPLVSAAVHINRDLARARERLRAEAETPHAPEAPGAPSPSPT
jgi:predicted PurR-regulated permease PerM